MGHSMPAVGDGKTFTGAALLTIASPISNLAKR
ncbi:hypothetical protein HD596_008367 [Nonomuraea jabiensis]|uniref:Uncharacterized protein n=1 Tax=Nonomuraea jabiensis TaxID=882448 RepID=A0A7W9GDH4_9ACTN|nr:hypothetical protein [Nonomuraea jabiensis]